MSGPAASGAVEAACLASLGHQVVCADIDFTVSRPWRLAPAMQRCRALVARVAPDVIHSHFVSTTLVARLALGRRHPAPRIFQVPGPLHLEHGFFRRLDLRTAGPRDVWVGSCAWTQQEYVRRGVPAERVFLSYYGTDVAALAINSIKPLAAPRLPK